VVLVVPPKSLKLKTIKKYNKGFVEGRHYLRSTMHRWEDNIKKDFNEKFEHVD
jgi:hypothetical protein